MIAYVEVAWASVPTSGIDAEQGVGTRGAEVLDDVPPSWSEVKCTAAETGIRSRDVRASCLFTEASSLCGADQSRSASDYVLVRRLGETASNPLPEFLSPTASWWSMVLP